MESKKRAKLTLNLCLFQGKVVDDPVINDATDKHRCAFMKIRTLVSEFGVNGQWTTSVIIVPLIVIDQSKVAVVEKYIRKGRELLVTGYFKSWKVDGSEKHAIVVTKIDLGSKGS